MALNDGTPAVRIMQSAVTAAILLATAFQAFAGSAAAGLVEDVRSICTPAGPDPFLVDLVPTANANGARGSVTMRFADSPFSVTVTADGHHAYAATVLATGLAAQGDALVVWAATPALDQVSKLGTLDASGRLEGEISFNKFLVFITAETSPDVERWAGPILLRGASPSARLHTMIGHGPFTTESCREWGFGPPGSGRQPDRLR